MHSICISAISEDRFGGMKLGGCGGVGLSTNLAIGQFIPWISLADIAIMILIHSISTIKWFGFLGVIR